VVHDSLDLLRTGKTDEGRVEGCFRELAAIDACHALAEPIARAIDALAKRLVAEQLVEQLLPLALVQQ
jgi:hypothetical protein